MKTRSSFYYRRWRAGFRARSACAFSLIEVLVVTGLLSVIIFGLVLMFGQTQRAFKLGTTQVDVLEGGRMVTDMLTREVAQMSPALQSKFSGAVNCFVEAHNTPPMVQALPGNVASAPRRTNLLMDAFFLSKVNQVWEGIGYRVLDPVTGNWPQGGVGTLYRINNSTNNLSGGEGLARIYQAYQNAYGLAALTNASRILDGVVHFKVRAFDTGGFWIDRTRSLNVTNSAERYFLEEPAGLFFYSNALPVSLEFELGILEAKTAERARSISDNTARANFLAEQAGKVHVFRWRVPVRNVDPSVYQ